MDPQHRQFLECAWEALDDAGTRPGDGSPARSACSAGAGMNTYLLATSSRTPTSLERLGDSCMRHTGNDKDFLATRVSYKLDLRGPSVNVQTACSTSLVAVHLACQSLLDGECDLALAGGVSIECPHAAATCTRRARSCRPTASAARSTRAARRHGARRAASASWRSSGSPTRSPTATRSWRSSAGRRVNNDGAAQGRLHGAERRRPGRGRSPRRSPWPASTPRDDRLRRGARHRHAARRSDRGRGAHRRRSARHRPTRLLRASARSRPTSGTSTRPPASPASSRRCSALEHGEMPPSLHFERRTRRSISPRSPFIVERRAAAVAADGRRAAPASARSASAAPTRTSSSRRRPRAGRPGRAPRADPGAVGARPDRARRRDRAARRLLEAHPDGPRRRRAHAAGRAAAFDCGARSWRRSRRGGRGAALALDATPQRAAPGAGADAVVFLFPGGGAQYPGMAPDLYESEPVFRDAMDRAARGSWRPATWTSGTSLCARAADPRPPAARLEPPVTPSSALFVTGYALASLWLAWGVGPRRSSVTASASTWPRACRGRCRSRTRCASSPCAAARWRRRPEGRMLAVSAGESAVTPLLADGLWIWPPSTGLGRPSSPAGRKRSRPCADACRPPASTPRSCTRRARSTRA